MSSEIKVLQISDYLSRFESQIKHRNGAGLFDINKHAETILRPILSEMFNCSLIRSEEYLINYPAVDLIDKVAGIAIQVTSTADSKKIKETLGMFIAKNGQNSFNKLYVYIITERQKHYSSDFEKIIEKKK